MSFSGNIGPRRPTLSGENCLNCGQMFIMEPGVRTDEEGIHWATWRCNGCNRVEEWAIGRNERPPENVITRNDIVE